MDLEEKTGHVQSLLRSPEKLFSPGRVRRQGRQARYSYPWFYSSRMGNGNSFLSLALEGVRKQGPLQQNGSMYREQHHAMAPLPWQEAVEGTPPKETFLHLESDAQATGYFEYLYSLK